VSDSKWVDSVEHALRASPSLRAAEGESRRSKRCRICASPRFHASTVRSAATTLHYFNPHRPNRF